MISIIICSRNKTISSELKINIQSTINVEYELIVIDNSKDKYSIFQAYNLGVSRAKYPYLCFMHEDILYHTKDWGNRISEYFKDNKVGLIGVVGGHYMPKCPASWWSTQYHSGQYLQGLYVDHQHNTKKISYLRYKSPDASSINVTTVDGFWFCIPRDLFHVVKFDEDTFKGFHCYDTDICFQILNQNKEVRVVFDILIEHISTGSQDSTFLKQRIICFEKWFKFLPYIKGIEISDDDIEDRLKFAEDMNSIYLLRNEEMEGIRSSYAYRLGKMILKPFSYIRQKIK